MQRASVAYLFPAALGLAAALGTPVHAAVVRTADLADLELEQLANIVVTSVSRRAEPLASAAASIYVITNEQIRRSGVTSLPEALRLAPNLQVARADINQYAITARGSNSVLANKLLVLIDGRIVYSPLFSGVFWEVQDVLLEDIDRIEVISGPGATLWGANAVNGVINIVTQSARTTQGVLAGAGAGNQERGGFARYGATVGGNLAYRIYGQAFERDASQFAGGSTVGDGSDRGQFGFRIDSEGALQRWTLQGDAYQGDIDQLVGARDISGGNLLARWSRTLADRSALTVQTYFDRRSRDQPGFTQRLSTFDLDMQYGFVPLSSHSMLVGAGYRHSTDRTTHEAAFAFIPEDATLEWAHAFVQDEIELSSEWRLTLGAKVERNDYTGFEFLPNVRVAWLTSSESLLWSAFSRAVRAPARIDREFFTPATPPFFLAGGPDFQSEIANVFEIGYRRQFGDRLSLSATSFYHDFDRLRGIQPRPGGARFENTVEGRAYGAEAWTQYRVTDTWRLSAGAVAQRVRFERAADGLDVTSSQGNDPSHWWTLRSSHDIPGNFAVDILMRRVGALPSPAVPAYVAVDFRIGWRPVRALEASLTLQNAFDPAHPEWGVATNRAELPRTLFAKLVWRQ